MGVSLSQLIRDSLDAALAAVSGEVDNDPLFESVIYDDPAPKDGAAKHDEYLYEVNGDLRRHRSR